MPVIIAGSAGGSKKHKDATVTPDKVLAPETFYGKNGKETGTLTVKDLTSDATAGANDIRLGKTAYTANGKENGTFVDKTYSDFVKDATANSGNVAKGKVFYNNAGRQIGEWDPKATDFTSDATATPDKVLAPYTFYGANGKKTGTFVEKAEKVYSDFVNDATAKPEDIRLGKIGYNNNGRQVGTWNPKATDFTSDATATPDKVLAPYTFYGANGKKTGTFVEKAEKVYSDFVNDATAKPEDIRLGKIGYNNNGRQVGTWNPKATDFTSDATAAKQHILNGYTAYGKDGLITGAIPIYKAGPNPVLSDDIWISGDDLIYGAGRYGAGGYYEPNANLVGSGYDVARTIGLTASKLAPGNKILGVTGTYGSDATATPGDVPSGKVFYNKDGRQVGTGTGLMKNTYSFSSGTILKNSLSTCFMGNGCAFSYDTECLTINGPFLKDASIYCASQQCNAVPLERLLYLEISTNKNNYSSAEHFFVKIPTILPNGDYYSLLVIYPNNNVLNDNSNHYYGVYFKISNNSLIAVGFGGDANAKIPGGKITVVYV